jgi:hypothetical protein
MATIHPTVRRISLATVLAAALATAGCGGGGGGSSSGAPAADAVGTGGTGVISGAVVKGPVANATVTAFALSGGQAGAQIGTATTDASGSFTMNIGGYAGAVMLRASGGSYTDEATGQAMSMGAGNTMTAAMPSMAAGTTATVQLTPVTAMAQAMAQRMQGGMTDANIGTANAAMGSYFGVGDILRVPPMNPLVAGSGATANQDARNYGMTLAAMSQYARTAGMGTSAALVPAMMDDASDGMMDGLGAGGRIQMGMGGMMGGSSMMPAAAGSSGLANAMTSYMNSGANKSGLTAADMGPLIQRLSTSSGKI